MTEEEYLKKRISEIESNLSKIMISKKERINQNTALRFYKNTLDRILAEQKDDPPYFF